MKNQFGFIGCGNMGGALAQALSKSVKGEQIALCDAFLQKAEDLAKKCQASVMTATEIAAECDYIFLGVKPQMFEEMLSQIRPTLQARKKKAVLISMAAGIGVSTVERLAGCDAGVIRIMPNTPVSVGKGMILYCSNDFVTKEEVDIFCEAMKLAGKLDPISEHLIDAASALSGCGPAFVYLFAEALADGAVECGLPRDKALLYAAQTLSGAAELLLQTQKHPGELKDAVCSPGGTTIAGVHALENGGFRAAAMNAVTSAYEKTLSLKK